jgi:CDP-paratose 2-epimerase
MPERILVTGGAGFVGSHAAEYYAKRGKEVTILDNLSRVDTLETADESRNTAAYNLEYLRSQYPAIKIVEADVRNTERLVEVIEEKDAVIHTAGQVAVTASLQDIQMDFEVNARGTLNVLEAARKATPSPAVVFASTNKVYGDNVNDVPVQEEETRYWYDKPKYSQGIPENFPIDRCKHTPYGVSKLAGDLYAQDYTKRDTLDTAVFRMSCIYGPRQFGNEDQGWVAHFAISALRGEPITIFGDGKQVRDVLYVKDLIRAYDAFLQQPNKRAGVYNIGGGPANTISLLEFLDILEDQTNHRPETTYDEWREGDQKVYVSDISRAKKHLNWKPRVDFNHGIKKYIEWWDSAEKLN